MDGRKVRSDTVGRMAVDSLRKASVHKKGLEKTPGKSDNWVEKTGPGGKGGQLPAYIQRIAIAVRKKQGVDTSRSIAIAIGTVKRWAAGGGDVDATTRAAAAKALTEWEALKGKAKAKKISETLDERLTAAEQRIMEAVMPPGPSVLDMELADEEVGDLSKLTEAAAPVRTSNAKRRGGESLTSWGKRLQGRDKQIAKNAEDRKKTRAGSTDSDFESKHKRARDGKFTFKSGSSGDEVQGIQRRVGGTKVDGKFGGKTAAAVRRFQKRHGLQVDGIVGAQTLAAMRGKKGKVAPGAMTAADRRWLVARARRKS